MTILYRKGTAVTTFIVPNGTVACGAAQTGHAVLSFSNEDAIFVTVELPIQQGNPKAVAGNQSTCSLLIGSQIVSLTRSCLHLSKVILSKVS